MLPAAGMFHPTTISPATGLATDYLNHFNEAIMLLDTLAQCPDLLEDFLAWTPMSYREHFAASRLKERDAIIAAYDKAEPTARRHLEALATAMTTMLEATRIALRTEPSSAQTTVTAGHVVTMLKPLVARAGAVINGVPNGEHSAAPPQAEVDRLMVGA
jgi:hypothetical protein